MTTPVADFLRAYAASGTARLHMPGHKGRGPLGCEAWDLTEISGADSLYEAAGVIARSEENAAALFGSAATFYSTEGATQCIKAMLFLALRHRPAGTPPVILAARNVHKSFVHAAALLDFEPLWLWPEEGTSSLCACPVTAEDLEKALECYQKAADKGYKSAQEAINRLKGQPPSRSPARTIWGTWRTSPPWRRCAMPMGPCFWRTTPTGPICAFYPPPFIRWTRGRTSPATPPTRLCRSSPAERISTSPKPPRRPFGSTPGPPWPSSGPPARPT